MFVWCWLVVPAAPRGAEVPGLPSSLPSREIRERMSLNGQWDIFQEGSGWATIQVPATWGLFHNYRWFDYPLTTDKPAKYVKPLYTAFMGWPEQGGKVIRFAVGASFFHTTVSVNGTEVGEWTDGFSPFEFVISPHLNYQNDTLTVDIGDTAIMPFGACSYARFHRGMWQDVMLKAYPEVFVENNFFVKTSFRNKQISCDIPVKNLGRESRSLYIRNFVTDHTGAVVLTFDVDGLKTVGAGDSVTFSCSRAWRDPRLWFPYDPYRYTIHTVMYEQDKTTVIDWKKTRFGFKEFYRDGNQFRLNRVKTKLRGDSQHYFGEYQQTRGFAEALFTSLKQWGVNYFRPHAMPYDPVLLDVADSMGIMIVAESGFYGSCHENGGSPLSHIRYWMERDRNHPSIIMWSCANEYNVAGGDPGAAVEYAKQFDPTRVIYSNDHYWCWDEVCSNHYHWERDPEGKKNDWGCYSCLSGEWVPKIQDPSKPQMMDEYGGLWTQKCFFGEQYKGPVGYEYACQDFGAYNWKYGIEYRDKTRGLQRADYAGYCSWTIIQDALRHQPFFDNADSHPLTWPDDKKPGAKPAYVFSGCHAINWCDPSLPLYDPLPNFYLYTDLFQPVRCSDRLVDTTGENGHDFNFFAGETVRQSFDLEYELLRPATSLRCEIVRRSDHAVIASTEIADAPFDNLTPGNSYENASVSWTAPDVDERTPVLIKRVFISDGQPVHEVSIEGAVFPRFSAEAHLTGLSGKTLGVYDPGGGAANLLNNLGVSFTRVSNPAEVSYPGIDVLLIGEGTPDCEGLAADFFISGGRALVLRQDATPSLPPATPSLETGGPDDIQYLLHGPRHAALAGLNQNDLSHWRGNRDVAGDPYRRPTAAGNAAVLLAADGDGDYAPLLEIPAGKGTLILCQMSLVAHFAEEPVAGHLLCNMLNYLGSYTPAEKAKTGLIAGEGEVKAFYDGLELHYEPVDAAALPDPAEYTVLIVDGQDPDIASSLSTAPSSTKLRGFVEGGGKVMVCRVGNATEGAYRGLLPVSIQLAAPSQTTRCIKSARGWRTKTTTREPVRFGTITIPPSWEPNPDRLLLGISNKDLDWTSDIIEQGVVPAKVDESVNILIAPRAPILSAIPGERTYHGKEHARCRYQNDWYADRKPALLKIEQGEGFWLLNQLLLDGDSERGTRLASLLLTTLGSSIGDNETYYNLDHALPARAQATNPTRRGMSRPLRTAPAGRAVLRIAGGRLSVPPRFRGGPSVVTVYDVAGKVRGRIRFDHKTPARIDCRTRLGIARGFHVVTVQMKN